MRKKNTFAVGRLRKAAAVAALIVVGWGGVVPTAAAQWKTNDIKLAREYYAEEQYEQAVSLFEEIAKDKKQRDEIYDEYLTGLRRLGRLDDAAKFVRKVTRDSPENYLAQADYALILDELGEEKSARTALEKLIEQVKGQALKSDRVATYFIDNRHPAWGEEVYLAARAVGTDDFALQLAELYYQGGEPRRSIDELLRYVESGNDREETAQNLLQNYLKEPEDFTYLEELLLEKVQKRGTSTTYGELLLWLYVQRKDFYGALIQAKSLDRRTSAQGRRVFEIGLIALENGRYEEAVEAFGYVSDRYPDGPYGTVAKRYAIEARETQVREIYPIKADVIRTLINDYGEFIAKNQNSKEAQYSMLRVANLHAFYLDEADSAKSILRRLLNQPRPDATIRSEAKLMLGDIYLFTGEPWESALLYSQVEKAEKEQPLGHQAKLKNAKLSYYTGNFSLAQDHLDILKMATSREISNDAMDLSLLIKDNLALDTIARPLERYATTELMVFKHRYDDALAALDALLSDYPNHSLQDEIWWQKATIYEQLGRYEQAFSAYQEVSEKYQDDLYGDDAVYKQGVLLEEHLNKPEEAMQYYTRLLKEYPGSIYVADARYRFRKLRGDAIN
ncbi:MAG: tetratricopeptide repeat protein [Catalinimonas sp.]